MVICQKFVKKNFVKIKNTYKSKAYLSNLKLKKKMIHGKILILSTFITLFTYLFPF